MSIKQTLTQSNRIVDWAFDASDAWGYLAIVVQIYLSGIN